MAARILMFVHLGLPELIHDIGQLRVDVTDAFVGALYVSLQRVSQALLLFDGLFTGPEIKRISSGSLQ